MTEDADPRQRIVLAAIDLLNREGLEAITTRRISEAAGVNVAAVNYYFGTKDNLVKQTLSLTLSHAAEDWETVMSDHRIPTPLRFLLLLDFISAGIQAYPGLVRSHLFEGSTGSTNRSLFSERLSGILDGLAGAPDRIGTLEQDHLRSNLGTLLSSVIFLSLIPDVSDSLAGIDISDPRSRWDFLIGLLGSAYGSVIEVSGDQMEVIGELRSEVMGQG